MVKIKVEYEGGLHCRLTHLPSGTVLTTDAPTDYGGRSESFSPTDLVASALGSCMMTIMGIYAKKHGISLEGSQVDVTKEMLQAPERRIGKLSLDFRMCAGLSKDRRVALEASAFSCPVHKSLRSDIEMPIRFHYPD